MAIRTFGLLVAVVGLTASCATNDTNIGGSGPSGAGGAGGTTTGGSGGGGQGGAATGGAATGGAATGGAATGGAATGGATTGGEGGGGPNLCGNGVKDMGEQCDGSDFGGKTCADFGLSGGFLICNPFCGVVVSSCTPAETCNDGQDNDGDGLYDCADDECIADLACTDPCAAAIVNPLPFWGSGVLSGKPNVMASSCVPNGGREAVFAVQATTSDNVSATLDLWPYDGVISVRTGCNDPATEIACANNTGPGNQEAVSVPANAGDILYFVFESTNANGDWFYVNITQPQPEFFCNDQWDDDSDGYIDCDDPDACQGSFDCMPGVKTLGQSCFSNNECFSQNGDPICLNWNQGFNNGYCSEFCNGAGDCPGDGVCVDINLSVHGVCFDGCVTNADCAPGTSCVDIGQGTKVCDKPPELNCQDYVDNDSDGFIDCEDPANCSTSFSCVPGSTPVGESCQIHAECEAQNGKPYCVDQQHQFWPGGYCSQFCTMGANECPANAECVQWLFFPSGSGMCAEKCASPADCRPGYSCFDPGIGTNVCLY